MDTFSITRTVRKKNASLTKGVPYMKMKEAVLGKRYELSLVFIGTRRSRTLTKQYRKKDKASNVLSFPIDTHTGEIFITPEVAKKEAKQFDKSPRSHIAFLFIHGLLHLSGMEHGSKMESKEKALRKRFGV